MGSAWIIGACTGILYSYYAEGPFVFTKIIYLSVSQFGQLGIFIALAALLGTLIAKKLMSILSQKHIMLLGMFIIILSSLLFILISVFAPITAMHKAMATLLIILPMMGLIFACFGFLIPATVSSALVKYKENLGRAGAIFGLCYYGLASLFIYVMGWLHNGKIWMMPSYFGALSLSIILVYSFIKPIDKT